MTKKKKQNKKITFEEQLEVTEYVHPLLCDLLGRGDSVKDDTAKFKQIAEDAGLSYPVLVKNARLDMDSNDAGLARYQEHIDRQANQQNLCDNLKGLYYQGLHFGFF